MGQCSSSLDQRQLVELVERWRGGQGPFERGCARTPGIGGRRRFAHERKNHERKNHIGEGDGHAGREHVGAQRRNEVPVAEGSQRKTSEELSADFRDAGTFLLTENRIDASEPRTGPCVPRQNRGAIMGGLT